MVDVERKFMENACRQVSAAQARRILDLVMGLDAASDVIALTEALNG